MPDKLSHRIAGYREELAALPAITNLRLRLHDASILAEKIVRVEFPDIAKSNPRAGLGELLSKSLKQIEESKVGAKRAVEIRNRISHYTEKGIPSDVDLVKAINILTAIIESFIALFEKPAETSSGRDSTGLSKPEASKPHVDKSKAKKAKSPTSSKNPLGDRPNAGQRISFEPSLPPLNVPTSRKPQMKIRRDPPLSLEAKADDPHVSASTVAEFVFCRRAGLITAASRHDPEDEVPSLGLLPVYEKQAIKEEFVKSRIRLIVLALLYFAAIVILSERMLGLSFYLPAIFGVTALAFCLIVLECVKNLYPLWNRYTASCSATPCNPDPNSMEFQAVDWWGLLEAEYKVTTQEEPLHDDKWKISGKPRRILMKGSYRIPVFRIRKTGGRLSPQQIIRATILCQLLETQAVAESPFAVVLYGNSYKGTTVPFAEDHRRKFYKALEEAREAIRESSNDIRQPPKPINRAICSECPYGRPRPVEDDERTMYYDVQLDPIVFEGAHGKFHCDCGDLFQWKPPHNRNEQLKRVD